MRKILVIGDGLLGSEITKQTHWDYISRRKDGIDFDNLDSYKHYLTNYDEIFNCVGYTDTYSNDRKQHWETNYRSVCDLTDFCSTSNKKFIHVSSDVVYSHSKPGASEKDVPVHCNNWYGYTKLLGDGYVQLRSNDFLLFRCSFKPSPCKWNKAIVSQIGNFDYVNVIASFMIKLINQDKQGVYNLGTDIKTIYELAKQTNPEIEPMIEKLHETMPENVIMDVSKMRGDL